MIGYYEIVLIVVTCCVLLLSAVFASNEIYFCHRRCSEFAR